ncbi:recombinase family protein [Ruminiclostridium josui]|uniref:recombinase family protein n=1 Tax=Ruminiclostridium josui TaxID=1499 RepID=UPI000465DB63|nr:recombinase family protein [Ruminiclostridium josui]
MIYGYARVSTRGQATKGNSLEEQEKSLKEAGCSIIYEDAYTGTKVDRPKFNELIKILEPGDMLVVTKLDRFARSLTQGSELVTELIKRGIKVNILNIGMMDNTPASKLIRNIFFSFAEFERDMIVERTQEGKAIAKEKDGFHEGRPKKYTTTQIDMAVGLLEKYSYSDVEKMTQISKSTLVRAVRERRLGR